MKLNLGSGPDRKEDFLNVDFVPSHRPDVVADMSSLPFLDGVAGSVRAFDVLEHLPRTELARTLADWFRVIAPGGLLRARVPSVVDAVRAMRTDDSLSAHLSLIQNLFGSQNFTGEVHLNTFTDRTLADALHLAGFRRVSVEPSDRWMFDITAKRVDGHPVALFWAWGFHPDEGLREPADYESASGAWRWSAAESSIALVNTSFEPVRARLDFVVDNATHAENAVLLVTGDRRFLLDCGGTVSVDMWLSGGGRTELRFEAQYGKHESGPGDHRELFFSVSGTRLTLGEARGDGGAQVTVVGGTPVTTQVVPLSAPVSQS